MTEDKTAATEQPSPKAQPPEDPRAVEDGIPSVGHQPKMSVSHKGVLAVVLAIVTLSAISAISIQRAFFAPKTEEASKRLSDRPAAAGAEPRRLDLSLPIAAIAPASASSASGRMIPAIEPLPEEARAIPLRRTEPPRVAPEDAPVVLLASKPTASGQVTARPSGQPATEASESTDPLDATRRNLDAYQRQLQGLLDTLTKSTDVASKQAATAPPGAALPHTSALAAPPVPGGLFGGQLPSSLTPRVTAGLISNRSLTLPKGTAFTCALKTRLVSAASGFVSCQVLRNVYSDDGRVLLIERGSHMDGEYRATSVRAGTVRIPVLWTRVRTPNAVTVDIESPGIGPLGESGIDGYVDNRWVERIGAALLLSLIDDAVQIAVAGQGHDAAGSTVGMPSTTSSAGKLAEKVLDSTINIPPLIYQNQGAIVGIYVARDVDFSSVYELKAVER
jgi:type IV secretion system protein VirB10